MGVQKLKVAQLSDLPKNGTMKQVEFGSDAKILLAKVQGQIYANGAFCSHYGAPLAKGVITTEGRITCPWHGACFNAKMGDIEDAPGLDALQHFPVTIEGDDIYVEADPEVVKQKHRKPACKTAAKKEGAGVIAVGNTGAAFAVEALRQSGYEGKITLIRKEDYLPIDRTKLSKALIDDASKVALRDADFYKSLDVDIKLDTEVELIDVDDNTIKTSAGILEYEHLILSTGSSARKLPVDGVDLQNVFTLRSIADTKAINKSIGNDENNKSELVVIGSSFIGTEVAIAASKYANVTVVSMDNTPFENILGKEVGAALKKAHEAKGIRYKLGAEISNLAPSKDDPKVVGSVHLKSGESYPAKTVILGVGVKLNTDFLKSSSGVPIEEDGSLVVDEYLRVKGITKQNVYACGDIAKFPDAATKEMMRIEHWNVAANHGRAVGQTIAQGPREPFNKPALFWSAQTAQLRHVSTAKAKDFEGVHIDGSLDDLKFVAYYYKGDEIVAVCSIGKDPVVSQCLELLRLHKMPSLSDIKSGTDPLQISL